MMKRYKSLKDIDSDIEKVMKILQNSNISTYCKRDYTIQLNKLYRLRKNFHYRLINKQNDKVR